MTKRKHNYIILLLLAIIFICPGIAACLFYTHPQWLWGQPVNKGKLLNPPARLEIEQKQAKWRLILWNPDDCQENCLAQIDTLARVRLALGRRLLNVDELVIMSHQSQFPATLTAQLRDEDIQFLVLSKEQQAKQKLFDNQMHIFIANPDNYLVLTYLPSVKPNDIFHDLKRLLNNGSSS